VCSVRGSFGDDLEPLERLGNVTDIVPERALTDADERDFPVFAQPLQLPLGQRQ